MPPVSLRVVVPQAGQSGADGQRKTLKFDDNERVSEAVAQVVEKMAAVGETVGSAEQGWGLFYVAEDDPKISGKWLDPSKDLSFYELKRNALLEYRKRAERISVQYHDAKKIFMLDLSVPVEKLLEQIGEKLDIKAADEYGLLEEGQNDAWLKSALPIHEQVMFCALAPRSFLCSCSTLFLPDVLLTTFVCVHETTTTQTTTTTTHPYRWPTWRRPSRLSSASTSRRRPSRRRTRVRCTACTRRRATAL
jgi:N-terminal or F0 domain of Talin-head FERM